MESREKSLRLRNAREISAWKGVHGARVPCGIYQQEIKGPNEANANSGARNLKLGNQEGQQKSRSCARGRCRPGRREIPHVLQ